jgi:large subunit ribosomal protein L30
MYAVIRIRGTVNISPDAKKALELLNLGRINNLSIWQETEQTKNAIKTVQDYVTFGKINEEALKKLVEIKSLPLKKGQKVEAKKVLEELKKGKTAKQAGIKNLFKLAPPKGGYERKGIKVPYKLGGALGDRKEQMSELVLRMV